MKNRKEKEVTYEVLNTHNDLRHFRENRAGLAKANKIVPGAVNRFQDQLQITFRHAMSEVQWENQLLTCGV